MNCAKPQGPCDCCREGKPCAYVLQLDARQQAQIARIEALIGTASQHWTRTSVAPRSAYGRPVEIEPTLTVECPVCDRPYEMAAYLVEFLTANRAPAPKCEDCAAPRQQTIRGAA
jgi:hypothetical protein